MPTLKLTKENFDLARNSDKTVLIDFYADWCGPCRMVSPIIEEISDEEPELLVCKVNVDEEPELAGEFDISSIPALIVMKNGEIAERSVGARPKAKILDMVK